MRKWILWIPVLMMGSLVFWTIALNFGGLSLIALTSSLSIEPEGGDGPTMLKDSYQSITVNLSDMNEAPEPGAVDDSASVSVDVVPDHESDHDSVRATARGVGARGGVGRADQGPGETAF